MSGTSLKAPGSDLPALRDHKLLIVISVTLMEVMGTMSLGPALPGISRNFALSPQDIGLVTTAFVLPIMIGAPIFGLLADRFGRKPVLIPSLFLFALAGVACAFATSFEVLLALRFVQGIGAASLEALALALLADLYSGRRLTVAMGLNASMIATGLAVYPMLGGGLASFGWRFVFTLPVVAFFVGIWMWHSLDEPLAKSTAPFAIKRYLGDIWQSLMRSAVLGVLLLIAAVFILLFGAYLTYLPMLASELGAVEVQIGTLITGMAIAFAITSSQLGLLERLLSRNALIKCAFLLYGVALTLAPSMPSVWWLLLPSILFGAAHGLIFPATQTMLAELAPNAQRAGFMAVVAVAVPFGQTVGPIMGGLAFGSWGLSGVFYAGGVGALFLLALVFVILRPVNQVLNVD
jgi:MFS family permease